jgi:dTMP kinase
MHFIVLEGCDRFGKSTQVKLLAERFLKCGFKTRVFTFPNYGSATGKVIDDHLHERIKVVRDGGLYGRCLDASDPLIFQCVQTADKYAVASQIVRSLRDGEIVICGRWWQSAFIYGLDDGLDEQWLRDVHDCLPRADLNILLDASPDDAAARATGPGDRYERDLPKQRRLRDRYLKLWAGMAGSYPGWEVVPASGSIEEVHAKIVDAVKSSLVHLDGLKQGS